MCILENKKSLTNSIKALVYHNVYASSEKNGIVAYKNRMLAFEAEVSADRFIRTNLPKNIQILAGGILMPTTVGTAAHHTDVYLTISPSKPEAYIHLYQALRESLKIKRLFFVRYEQPTELSGFKKYRLKDWNTDIYCPPLQAYIFENNSFKPIGGTKELRAVIDRLYDKKPGWTANTFTVPQSMKNMVERRMISCTFEELTEILATRFIFDGMIGLHHRHGIPADIDLVLATKTPNQQFALLEIKEKDMSKQEPRGFGMDTRRMDSMDFISTATGYPYYYLLREIHDQFRREFKAWRYINLKDFTEVTRGRHEIEGGVGMATGRGTHPTLVAPQERFTTLPRNFREAFPFQFSAR